MTRDHSELVKGYVHSRRSTNSKTIFKFSRKEIGILMGWALHVGIWIWKCNGSTGVCGRVDVLSGHRSMLCDIGDALKHLQACFLKVVLRTSCEH